MCFYFEERSSDSSFVESVWHVQSDCAGSYTSIAINFKVGAFMPHLPPGDHVDARL